MDFECILVHLYGEIEKNIFFELFVYYDNIITTITGTPGLYYS